MKVIVFVSAIGDSAVISKVIESTRHHVVATITNPDSLNYATAQLTPHAVVAEDCHHLASSQAIASYRLIYPDVLRSECQSPLKLNRQSSGLSMAKAISLL